MRDPKRIPFMINKIQELWEQQPDLRLFQLLITVVKPERPHPELFYLEDDNMMELLGIPVDHSRSFKTWYPRKTIFVQIRDADTKATIQKWACDRSFDVMSGTGPDIVMCGYLFAIIEREEVDVGVWESFLHYLKEGNDLTPCVLLNTDRSEAEAGIPNLYFVPDPDSIDWNCYLDELLRESLAIPDEDCPDILAD